DFFGDEDSVGKTLGTDLESGKLTLPLIYLFETLDSDEKSGLRRALEEGRGADVIERAQGLMVERGIYSKVAAAVLREVEKAEAALSPFAGEAPTPLLLQIQERLLRQLAALKA